MATIDLSVRINPANPDHHLWNNNGTWWCHYTVHRPDYTKARIRRSLQTRDLPTARLRRDRLLVGLRTRGSGHEAARQRPIRRL